ncbi:late embryogenesis abundant protein At1g64065-like [Fagus crenata]
MAEREQVKPLAPAGYHTSRSDEEEILSNQLKLKQRKYIKCCGCFTALLLILAVLIIVLAFTVFHIRDPMVRINALRIQNLELANGTVRQDVNITLIAGVSVKNPNAASFIYSNSTTTIYYHGVMVGEARIPSGKAKARHTMSMNITVDIIPSKVLAVPSLKSDLFSGGLNMSSHTKMRGQVKILNIAKKNVVVNINCTMTYNFSSQAIQDQNCHPDIRD